jgi:alpha-D-ribose 1-methylphosphonate 5-triphosphate diphosphatase
MHEAIRMVSLNPALAVGLADRTGSIDIGKDADLVLAACAEGLPRVLRTFVRGREVFATC